MNHCKDCRFWSCAMCRSDAIGHCGILMTFPILGQDRAFIDTVQWPVVSDSTRFLITPASFGCVHFEAKEEA